MMMKSTAALLIPLLMLFLFFSCKSSITGPGDPIGELPRELTAAEKALIEADQAFSYDIFRRTVAYETEQQNLMISPLSISMALAMTLNGAEGQTYEDMREALYLTGMELDEINEAFKSLIELLMTVDPKVKVLIANSIWYAEWLPVKQDFLERVEDHFGAEIAALDFADPESVNIINDWVKDNTEELIEMIIEEIPDDMVMYLINALYFKGDWLRQFDPDDTRKADFFLESGDVTEVDMMQQEGLFASYFSNEVEMIELPYGDSLYSMTVLMPADPAMPIGEFVEQKLSASNLANWRSGLTADMGEINVELPKFEMEYEIEFNDILKAMGMEIAFAESEANFNGIADVSPQNLFISEVKHKTFIRVDEEGSEAGAVTSVGIGIDSLPPQMIVNRPFVFIIHERESGTNLFMGIIRDPS